MHLTGFQRLFLILSMEVTQFRTAVTVVIKKKAQVSDL